MNFQGCSGPSDAPEPGEPCGGARFFGKLVWVWRLPRGPRHLGLRESASAKKGVKPPVHDDLVFRPKADSVVALHARRAIGTSSLIHSTNPRVAIRGLAPWCDRPGCLVKSMRNPFTTQPSHVRPLLLSSQQTNFVSSKAQSLGRQYYLVALLPTIILLFC